MYTQYSNLLNFIIKVTSYTYTLLYTGIYMRECTLVTALLCLIIITLLTAVMTGNLLRLWQVVTSFVKTINCWCMQCQISNTLKLILYWCSNKLRKFCTKTIFTLERTPVLSLRKWTSRVNCFVTYLLLYNWLVCTYISNMCVYYRVFPLNTYVLEWLQWACV